MQPQPKTQISLPDIAGAWRSFKEKRIKQYPQNNLRASSIGHPCKRHHYHSIKDWREKQLYDAILQSIFDEGNLHEKDVMSQLTEMGFKVIEQQRAFQFDKPKITGTIDGILLWKEQRIPFDIKSISPHEFPKISSAEDMINSPKIWHRLYPAQIQIYMLMTESPVGCFIMKNKLTGELKPIFMEIDYIYADTLLQRAQEVYDALAKEIPPERINDFDICSKCAFKHICLPDLAMGPGVKVIEDVELVGLIERRQQLQEVAKEFKELDEQIKEVVTQDGPGEKIAGDWLIQVKEFERKAYSVEVGKYNVTKFVNLKKL